MRDSGHQGCRAAVGFEVGQGVPPMPAIAGAAYAAFAAEMEAAGLFALRDRPALYPRHDAPRAAGWPEMTSWPLPVVAIIGWHNAARPPSPRRWCRPTVDAACGWRPSSTRARTWNWINRAPIRRCWRGGGGDRRDLQSEPAGVAGAARQRDSAGRDHGAAARRRRCGHRRGIQERRDAQVEVLRTGYGHGRIHARANCWRCERRSDARQRCAVFGRDALEALADHLAAALGLPRNGV